MSHDDPVSGADAAEAGDPPQFDEGRYLYCIVRADAEDALDSTGVDGEPISVVAAEGVGAVVHACDGLYDSADLAQVRRWLVRHQAVVDDAADRFGTPVPFQFDTILRGDDGAVREWLRAEHDALDRALSALAGHWEYRVEVVEVDPPDDEALGADDDRVQELEGRIEDAGSGTAYLLEKQREQRLAELRAARRKSVAADLESRLASVARAVHPLERSPTATLSDDLPGNEAEDRDETLCRFTLLAHEDDEGAIGSVLDDVAATDGLEVRFTGPWPPYSFAPELGGAESASAPSETTDGGPDAGGDR